MHLPVIDLLGCGAAIRLAGDSGRNLHVWAVQGHAEPENRRQWQGPELMVYSVACNAKKHVCTLILVSFYVERLIVYLVAPCLEKEQQNEVCVCQ